MNLTTCCPFEVAIDLEKFLNDPSKTKDDRILKFAWIVLHRKHEKDQIFEFAKEIARMRAQRPYSIKDFDDEVRVSPQQQQDESISFRVMRPDFFDNWGRT